jgi:transcriptional regulator with XRE-family HTH domain
MLEATSRSPKEAQDQRAEVGQDIARQLQQARLARGEDLADIARQLHIRPAYLAALEQGQFELSVGRPYLLGFLRSYGTYLGLDGDKLVGALKQWLDQDAASPGPNERKPFVASRRGTAVMVTAALLLVAAVYATGPSILDHIDRGSGAGSSGDAGRGDAGDGQHGAAARGRGAGPQRRRYRSTSTCFRHAVCRPGQGLPPERNQAAGRQQHRVRLIDRIRRGGCGASRRRASASTTSAGGRCCSCSCWRASHARYPA